MLMLSCDYVVLSCDYACATMWLCLCFHVTMVVLSSDKFVQCAYAYVIKLLASVIMWQCLYNHGLCQRFQPPERKIREILQPPFFSDFVGSQASMHISCPSGQAMTSYDVIEKHFLNREKMLTRLSSHWLQKCRGFVNFPPPTLVILNSGEFDNIWDIGSLHEISGDIRIKRRVGTAKLMLSSNLRVQSCDHACIIMWNSLCYHFNKLIG